MKPKYLIILLLMNLFWAGVYGWVLLLGLAILCTVMGYSVWVIVIARPAGRPLALTA
jgi:hypothetical protein